MHYNTLCLQGDKAGAMSLVSVLETGDQGKTTTVGYVTPRQLKN
jgi:hypothetical protein